MALPTDQYETCPCCLEIFHNTITDSGTSRIDNDTNLCSDCCTLEAFALVGSRQRGRENRVWAVLREYKDEIMEGRLTDDLRESLRQAVNAIQMELPPGR